MICASHFLVRLFTSDEEVIAYGVRFITIISPFYMACCFNQIYAGALRGVGNAKIPMFIMLFSFVLFRQIYLFVAKLLGQLAFCDLPGVSDGMGDVQHSGNGVLPALPAMPQARAGLGHDFDPLDLLPEGKEDIHIPLVQGDAALRPVGLASALVQVNLPAQGGTPRGPFVLRVRGQDV